VKGENCGDSFVGKSPGAIAAIGFSDAKVNMWERLQDFPVAIDVHPGIVVSWTKMSERTTIRAELNLSYLKAVDRPSFFVLRASVFVCERHIDNILLGNRTCQPVSYSECWRYVS
jgi:hypothetical protein